MSLCMLFFITPDHFLDIYHTFLEGLYVCLILYAPLSTLNSQ